MASQTGAGSEAAGAARAGIDPVARRSRTASASASTMRAPGSTRTTTSPPTSSPASSRELRLEVAGKIDEVLRALVIDTKSDHNTQDTARRVAKMYLMEVFAGRYAARPR